MKVRFSILLLSLPVLLAVLWGFSYEESRLEPTRPLYINDIALYGDKLLTAERCDNTVSLYSRDGRNRLMSWHVAEPPTGVVSDGELIYVTTSFAKGGVEVINPKSDSPVKFIPTGRGACSPILSADGKFLYVCNQFQTTISEIDLATMVVTREVKVLREPRSALESRRCAATGMDPMPPLPCRGLAPISLIFRS